jgi:hypothetical protein
MVSQSFFKNYNSGSDVSHFRSVCQTFQIQHSSAVRVAPLLLVRLDAVCRSPLFAPLGLRSRQYQATLALMSWLLNTPGPPVALKKAPISQSVHERRAQPPSPPFASQANRPVATRKSRAHPQDRPHARSIDTGHRKERRRHREGRTARGWSPGESPSLACQPDRQLARQYTRQPPQ